MALVLPNSIFVHVPKCGGWTVRCYIEQLGIKTFEAGHIHTGFDPRNELVANYLDEAEIQRRTPFGVVRHPYTWYQSRWSHRLMLGWKMTNILDYSCAANDFTAFMYNIYRRLPGWCTFELAQINTPRAVVLKLEELRETLPGTLAKLEGTDPQPVGEDQNITEIHQYRSADLAILTPELKSMIYDMDRPIFDMYGYDPNI